MQRALFFKILIVVALTLLVEVPLSMIQSTISGRIQYRNDAVRSIAEDSVRQQSIMGPILVIPYTDEYEEKEEIPGAKPPKEKIIKRSLAKRLIVFPNDLKIVGNIDTNRRYRGIHEVLVYSGQHAISGDFSLPTRADIKSEKAESRITFGQPFVALAIDDVRGIKDVPKLTLDGKQTEFEQGTGLTGFANGLHASVAAFELKQPVSVKFSFELALDGIESLRIAPVAKNNHVTLTSKWPHPQFAGRFLPTAKTRVVNENGFTAIWSISSLATSTQRQILGGEQSTNVTSVANGTAAATAAVDTNIDYFSVAFIEPINVYSQADRAVKYGLLFVALTFASFFLFEILKRLPVHPMQYLLVGLALTLFFLLLLSLSEHIPFVLAYAIASVACIVLIGFYLAHVLLSWKRGFGFGVALTMLYGVLYGLLQSENNALVMGSILLFAVLAIIMIATRKTDWYQIGKFTSAAA